MNKLTKWDKFRYGLEFYGLLVVANLAIHGRHIKEDINNGMTLGLTREERSYFFERANYEAAKLTDFKIFIPGSPWSYPEYKPFVYERTKEKIKTIQQEEKLEKYLKERARRKQKILKWV